MNNPKTQFSSAIYSIKSSKDSNDLKISYQSVINILTTKSKQFQQLPNQQIYDLIQPMFRQRLSKPDIHFMKFLQSLVKLAYSSKSKLRQQLYQIIPDLLILLQKYHSNQQLEQHLPLKGIQTVILNIYNNQCHNAKIYNQSIQSNIDKYLKQLIKNTQIISSPQVNYKQLQQLTNFSNKLVIKTLLHFLYFYHISNRSQQSIVSFFRLIYVFCGGKTTIEEFNLYLLNKPNEKTIFVHRVSEEEMQWILLVLYYVYINMKHLKFEVIAAITMLRRKSANESKFRIYELAQSMLHLFENEYDDVF